MDFGIIYMQNKAATNAAMWLGFVIFSLFIFVPFLIWWLSIPLYVTLLVIGATKKFQVENQVFTFLFPLAPFAAACILCLAFWWCIPFIVNLTNDLFETFKSIFVSSNTPIVFLKEEIPDEKCYLYFILYFGGAFSCFFSLMNIFCMEALSLHSKPSRTYTKSKWKWDKNDNIDAYCRASRKQIKPMSQELNLTQENKLYREQQYNVEKWKQRQKRKQQKKHNK